MATATHKLATALGSQLTGTVTITTDTTVLGGGIDMALFFSKTVMTKSDVVKNLEEMIAKVVTENW